MHTLSIKPNPLARFVTAPAAGLTLALTLVTAAPTSASAQVQRDNPPQVGVDRSASDERDFSKLLRQRNALSRKLYDLDRMAARELVKTPDAEPVSLYAQQQAAQDELDYVSFRLQVLAMRLNKPLPAAPSAPNSDLHGSGDETDYKENFSRGRVRAVGVIRQRTKDMLSSLNFADYTQS